MPQPSKPCACISKPFQSKRWNDFVRETTLHGLKNVFHADRGYIRSLIWLFAMLSMLFTSAVVIMGMFQKYFSYPIFVVASAHGVPDMDFPAVTICNFNKVRKSYVLAEDPVVGKAILYTSSLTKRLHIDGPIHVSPNFGFDRKEMTDEALRSRVTVLDMETIAKDGAHQLNRMMLECHWKNSLVNCSDYLSSTKTTQGFCYTFNSRQTERLTGPLITTRSGFDRGFTADILIDQWDYLDTGTSPSAGVKVMVHGLDILPSAGFSLSPGFEYMIPIRSTQTNRLPEPYQGGPCYGVQSPDFRNPLAYYNVYSKESCQEECERNFTVKACGCRFFAYKGGDTRPCNALEQAECYEAALDMFRLNDSQTEACGCVVPCHEVSFDEKISMAYYPHDFAKEQLVRSYGSLGEDFFRKNVLRFSVYYEHMRYSSVDHVSAYTNADMQADIGGQLGLCLGASLLTVLEFVDYLTVLVLSYLKTERKVKQHNHRVDANTGVINEGADAGM